MTAAPNARKLAAGTVAAPAGPAGWNTLKRLEAWRIITLALLLVVLSSLLVAAHVHRAAMQTVGKDTAPSILAAQHIKSALADMDADAANELIAPAALRSAAQAGEGDRAYEARRTEAARSLIAAAENITFGDSERMPIQTLQVGLGSYERLIQYARDLHDTGNANATAAAYRDAAALLDGTLLPAADALDRAKNDVLVRTYTRGVRGSAAARFAVGFLGLALLAALVVLQLFLAVRMRRTFNPALLGATLLTAGLTLAGLLACGQSARQLKVADEDAFASMHVLWRARAIAYQANGNESRLLLDPARAATYKGSFDREADLLAVLPAAATPEQVIALERQGNHVTGFAGYLADELNNITFAGERESAVRSLEAFAQYRGIDSKVRALELAGRHADAVTLCLGLAPGQSDWAFNGFDEALGATLALNQAAFDAAVAGGFRAIAHLELITVVGGVLIAVLIVLGLAPRLREYQG